MTHHRNKHFWPQVWRKYRGLKLNDSSAPGKQMGERHNLSETWILLIVYYHFIIELQEHEGAGILLKGNNRIVVSNSIYLLIVGTSGYQEIVWFGCVYVCVLRCRNAESRSRKTHDDDDDGRREEENSSSHKFGICRIWICITFCPY